MLEIWKQIVGYEKTHQVSNFGHVRRLHHVIVAKTGQNQTRRAMMLCRTPDSDGYYQVKVAGKSRAVHTLVAEAFHGPRPDDKETCHNDGNLKNCRWDNLRYDTHKGNAADRKKHGTELIGSRRPSSKLTEITARQALIRANAGENKSDIARDLGVAPSTISVLASRKTWTHIHV